MLEKLYDLVENRESKEPQTVMDFLSCFAKDGDDRRGFRTVYTGPAHPYGNQLWPIPALGIGYTETKMIEVYEFLKGIADGTPTEPNFRDGYITELISDAILESARTHTWTDVKTIE